MVRAICEGGEGLCGGFVPAEVVDRTVLFHDAVLSVFAQLLAGASIWPFGIFDTSKPDITLIVINTSLGINRALTHKLLLLTDPSLAHPVLLTEPSIFQILCKILGKLTSFVGIFIVYLRFEFADIVIVVILILGGYPCELAVLQVAHLVEGAQVSVYELDRGALRVLIAHEVTNSCIAVDGWARDQVGA